MSDPLINVITRFSRKDKFLKALESLSSQTYNNIRHYVTYETQENLGFLQSLEYKHPTAFIRVPNYNRINNLHLYYEHHDGDTDYLNWDWEKWDVQTVLGEEIPPRNEVECKKQRYYGENYWCESLPHSLRKKSTHSPYNLYVKIAETCIGKGWIVYLDDDDVYTSNESIQILVNSIKESNEDTLHVFRMKRKTDDGENIVPSNRFFRYHTVGHPIIHGEVGSGCICFHSKYKEFTQWGHWSGDDYRTIKALERVIPYKKHLVDILYDALEPGVGII